MDLPRLRRIRQGAVMSQEELAERSGVARDTISKLETGRSGAYPSTIRKLAAGLEVRPQMLMGGVEYLDEAIRRTGPQENTSRRNRSGTGRSGSRAATLSCKACRWRRGLWRGRRRPARATMVRT